MDRIFHLGYDGGVEYKAVVWHHFGTKHMFRVQLQRMGLASPFYNLPRPPRSMVTMLGGCRIGIVGQAVVLLVWAWPTPYHAHVRYDDSICLSPHTHPFPSSKFTPVRLDELEEDRDESHSKRMALEDQLKAANKEKKEAEKELTILDRSAISSSP